ncbi:type I toxin-antitoxin system Fst family toxin [Aerococcus urinaeequi]|uniref:type I toxin-antitoxin system Fst family toxin n=1 Tax=Aerococcus urinaeequi TaxID=51665 RepID=UPI003D6A75B4
MNTSAFCPILNNGNCPRRGCAVMQNLFTLIVAPICVGIALVLFERWLDDQDND